jgi:hypothetical protein
MTAIIPDTLQGALILSLIDFLLSFVIISFIGILLTGFPLLNRAAAWLEARRPAPVAKAVAPKPAPEVTQDVLDEDIVAIMAAVSAMVTGEHRILNIEPSLSGVGWLAAGRQAQHLSHQPQPRGSYR